MKLTAGIRCGVCALCDIAYYSGGAMTQAHSISKRQGVSPYYIEQIFWKLRAGGIIKSMRGPTGGYCLARKPEDISIGDVIRAVEGRDIQFVRCIADEKSQGKAPARRGAYDVSRVWTEGSSILVDYFDSVTIEYLCAEARKKGIGFGQVGGATRGAFCTAKEVARKGL